uniref:Uncharacterized protein n=1 Tax=Globodera rostochiensis TaxID=31243 RepID=A0A914GZY5_GLORO
MKGEEEKAFTKDGDGVTQQKLEKKPSSDQRYYQINNQPINRGNGCGELSSESKKNDVQTERQPTALPSSSSTKRKSLMVRTREAREVFLKMEPERRLSRMVRAEWLLEHFGSVVILEKDAKENHQQHSHHHQQQSRRGSRLKGVSVCGLLSRELTQPGKDERLRLGPNTTVTFLASSYRVVFVIDLSPSSFVIDDLDSVLYNRLIEAVIKCLRSLVKKMDIPGACNANCPTILLSLCAFSPFLCFPNDNVLLQGVLLRKESLDSVIGQLVIRVKHFVDTLVLFAQPHMREWSAGSRRSRMAKESSGKGRKENSTTPFRRVAMAAAVTSENLLSSDRGFVHSDWALIFMLRMGILSVQMMQPRSLANIVIVTDGVCSVFDQQALQGILAQLRLHSIACSFIQLRSASLRGPVLGHVGFPELFKFIATATLGTFLFEDQLDPTDSSDPLDPIQRALLTWSFQRGSNGISGGLKSPSLGEMRANYVRNKRFSRVYEGSLANLLSARLFEGYSVRHVDEIIGCVEQHPEAALTAPSATLLLIHLSLAWRPLVTIEYNIYVPKLKPAWPSVIVGQRNCALQVEVFIEAHLSCSTSNLLGERQDPFSLRAAIASLSEVDTLLLHLNSFNSDSAYWELPKEVERAVALFEFKKSSLNVELTERYESLRHSKFVSYWQPFSAIDEAFWQRLMHTHTVRLILAHDYPLPDRMFTSQRKGRFSHITSEMAFNELHAHLKRWASFALVRDQLYVCLLHEGNGSESPTKKNAVSVTPHEFFLIRTAIDLPCAIVRLSFPGSISAQTRDDILRKFTNNLGRLRTIREIQTVEIAEKLLENSERRQMMAVNRTVEFASEIELPSLCIVQKPFERILIRYHSVPCDLRRIVRLERTDSPLAKREMVLHNAVASFLSCRRQVWHFRDIFIKRTVPPLSSFEFILQTLLRLRLNQGFQLAYSRNGIITLIRQVPAQKLEIDSQLPVLEQCVLFGPTIVENGGGEQLHFGTAMNASLRRPRSLQNELENDMNQLVNNNNDNTNGDENFGTIESSRSGTLQQTSDSGRSNATINAQMVTEVWSEPTVDEGMGGGMERSRNELLRENDLLIRTLFTFDQLMGVCNSRLWVDKPFLLETAKDREGTKCHSSPDFFVQFMTDPFDLNTLLRHATQRHLMMLPAMGYADGDPHSLTRLSFLFKGLQRELSEFCDVCIEVSDEALVTSIISELEQCNSDEDELSDGFEISQTPSGIVLDKVPAATFPIWAEAGPAPADFHESSNERGAPTTLPNVDDQSFLLQQQLNQRSTSVPLLCDEQGRLKPLLRHTKGFTPTNGIEKASTSNRPPHSQRLASASTVNVATAQQRREEHHQRMAHTPSAGFLLGPPNSDECELRKKLSAPTSVTAFSQFYHQGAAPLSMNQFKSTKTPAARSLRVYAKRLNNWCLLVYVIAKDARMCRQMMKKTTKTFPVMAFLCDKPRMARNFVECGGTKTSGCYAAANAVLLETDYSALISMYLPVVDLYEHSDKVFHQQLFTKAFISSVYACLCQELFVPVPVLADVLHYRCEPTKIEVGSINEILRDTCTHLATLARTGDEPCIVTAPTRQLPLAPASSSTSNGSSPSGQTFPQPPGAIHSLSLPNSMNRSSGEDTLVMAENGGDDVEPGGGHDCRTQLDDFRTAFDQLLQRHSFYRVPGLSDFFFHWPKHHTQQEYSLSSMNLPGLEDFVKIPMTGVAFSSPPVFGTAPPLEVSRPEPKKASNFTRHSSARNTTNRNETSAASIVECRRRHTNAMESVAAKQVEDDQREAQYNSLQRHCCHSESTASWELDPFGREVYGTEGSEKSSLAGELLSVEKWPLFIQFSVSLQEHNGQSESIPVGFIPNCLKQIVDRCDISLRQQLFPSVGQFNLDHLSVHINMVVLTWPLQQQLPQHFSGEDRRRILEDIFGGSDGSEWLSHLKQQQQKQSGDELFERKVELLRQIPAEERRLLRKLQRNVQKMMNIEHVLITSRSFESREDVQFGTLLGVAGVIRDEVEGSTGSSNGHATEQTLARFDMTSKELVLVAEPEDGLRRLGEKLNSLSVEYCRLRELSVPPTSSTEEYPSSLKALPFDFDSLLENTLMLFYTCGVADLERFARTRHDSIRQIGHSFKRLTDVGGKAAIEVEEQQDPLADGEVAFILAGNAPIGHTAEGGEADLDYYEEEEEEGEDEEEEEEDEEREEQGEGFCNSSTTADDGTIAELTMPLNDSSEYDPFSQRIPPMHIILGNQHNHHNHQHRHHSGHVAEESSVDNLLGSRSNLLKRRQLLHDFWLIVQVEAGRGAAAGSESGLSVNIFFCQRSFLLHDQLFESACRLVEEQIRLVNQEVLLERMHQTEECDQLLVDHDFAPQLKSSYGLRSMGSLDPAGIGTATRPVPGEALTRAVSARLALQSSSSLLMEGGERTATAPMPSTVVSHVRDNSLTYSDEEGDHSVGALNELVRCKFRPGHFACEMVWHHWFAIHPRLQPSRTFSGGNDIGFKALRLGLEGLAVRNRSNMYVYKERNGNVVYLRLHATEESILGNIPGGNCADWEEEVRKRSHNCILLAVHGVRPPGEEITEQLMNVLQRRLNSRTLEEIQNALLKNAHIRLEWSDIKFIQREPDNPNAVFFFTVPQLARHHLGSVKYYLSQQMLTFCISPKFREQSGAALHRGKYSGSASTTGVHYFSGGGTGTSRALSLAGTPTLEHHHHYHHQWTTKGSMEGRESLQHTFVPFTVPNTQSNPAGYSPTFYLVNKPPGEGKRDTGIACLEGRLDADGRLILLRGGDTSDPIQKVSRMNEMSKCIRVNHVGPEVQPMPNTCALFQFNMWQNGNVGVDELENRLRMCVHQAICDLVTEFGLLSMPLFEAALSPIRSKAGSFSISNTTPPIPSAQHSSGVHHQNSNSAAGLKPYSSSELPKPQSAQSATGPPNADGFVSPILTTAVGSSASNHSPVKPFGQQQQQQKMGADPVGVASRSERNPVTMPLMGRHQRQLQSPILFMGDDQHHQQQQQLQHLQSLEHEQAPGELLRADFVAVADVWFGHVINETKGSPEMSHSIRKFQFRLDSDTSVKKIVQVVEQKLAVLLKNERLVVCRNAPVVETAHPRRHFLQTLNSFSSLLDDPTERDLGRLVNVVSKGAEPPELVLIAFNEQISQDTLRMAHDSPAHSASIAKFADHTQIGGGSSAQCHDVVVADSRKSSAVTGRISAQRVHPLDSLEMDEEEEEMRIWRSSHEPMQMFARRMSCVSSLGCWRNRATAPVSGVDPSALMMPANTTTAAAANSATTLSSRISLSKFLPCTKPFIPRQRLLYLLVRGETINLFLYNYTNDVVAKAREIVERCTLWHNARSRLLREIGLHKMGITHLSTLKSADARLNSYMLLTWMDPETLVNNDYPVDSLTTPDFSNIPRIYAQLLLKLYRFADPAFVAKGISPWVFEDQTQQMLALREDVRSMLNDHRLFTEVHNALRMETSEQKPERRQPRWTQETATAVDPSLPEEVLAQLVGRSHEVHFVMSPLLLFPSWRRRVAAIRTGAAAVETTDVVRTEPGVVGTATACLDKHGNAVAAHSIRKKQEGAAKALGQFPPSADASVSAMSCRRYPMDPEEEPCVLRIQQLLIEDYLSYLRSIGLQIVHIDRATNSPQPIVGPTCGLVQQQHHHQFEQHLSSGSVGSMSSSTVGHQQKHVQTGKHHHQQQQQNASHPHQKGKPTQPSTETLIPEVWLYKPFFCLRIFAFHAAPQLDEHLRSNQQQRKNCARLEDNVHSVRLLEQAKNELIRQCHVHSFVYDFHLRMIMRYLVGEGQVMFNPGYNINAFLIDFLQYYACRPPLARNCVYEEIVHCSDLKVSALSIWEHFMCSEQRFGWKVIRLKNLDSSDEFMLIAKERRAAFGLDYELVRVVINPREQREKEHRITLKLYVLLVTEMTAPFILTETSPTAREEGIAETATRDEAVEQKGSMAPEGGEFTELVNNTSSRNALKRTDQQQQFVVPKEDDDDDHDQEDEDGDQQKNSSSLCSTLIGPAGSESKMTRELVDDVEEENGTFTTPAAAAAEEAKEDSVPGVEAGTEASVSSTFAPMGHHRRGHPHIQRPVVLSSGTLGHRFPVDSLKAVVPSQLARADYCYECVLAAAAELQRSTGFGAARHRRKFCSGGVLLGASAARKTDAARMSLPPSRTSTASTSSSIRKMAKKQHSLNRQRSESSQLSTESRVNILQAKKQHSNASFGADEHGSLTPANSLKGLSEWRTNQQLNQTKLGKDWTLLEEEQHQWENSHNSRQKLAIQIGHPPRRHRAHQHQRGRGAQTTSACWEANDRTSTDCERGAVLPSEQVTYLHYLSSRQRRLQILLEEEVHADRLVQFVRDADSYCYVDTLWKSLLASRTFQFPGQRAQSLFISSTSSKTSDFFPDAFVKRPTALSSDLEPFDFEAMLHVVGVEAVAKREPRVVELLRGLNWTALCRFLVQLFEGERRCRYFESSLYSYLVITNPQFLDSAALFRHSLSNGDTELFLMFKRADDVYWKSKTDAVVDAFAGQSIRKLLKEVISSLCTFVWSQLLQNSPCLA